MTTTTIVTTDKATYEAMIERADAQTLVNTKEIDQIQARLGSIDAELATLNQRALARHQLLSTSSNTLAAARTRASDLEAQAVMSEGTAVHADVTKEEREHKKKLARIEKEHTDLHTRLTTEEQSDGSKSTALQTEHQELHTQLSFLVDQNAQLARGKTQAFSAIGQLEYEDVQAQIDQAKATIAAHEKQLEEDRAALKALVEASMSRLANWQQYALEVKKESPHEDATTRIIESCLAYVKRLRQDGMQLKTRLNVPSEGPFWVWWQALCVDRTNMYVQHNLQSPDAMFLLQQQEMQLNTLLAEYRATK
jgi:chromosome segregation ATPase